MLSTDALAILDQAEQAKARARNAALLGNHLVIGFVPSAEVNLLPKVMPLLRLRQPETQMELVSLITTQQEENCVAASWMSASCVIPSTTRKLIIWSCSMNRWRW
jgi:hypothetical protein